MDKQLAAAQEQHTPEEIARATVVWSAAMTSCFTQMLPTTHPGVNPSAKVMEVSKARQVSLSGAAAVWCAGAVRHRQAR
jgi:hypothetical protein